MRTYTDRELLFAATGVCRCGAGLAYPLDHAEAMKLGAWVCSSVLRGEVEGEDHDALPFAFWKVREETSINNRSGSSTRPPGTVARTVGRARCPRCDHRWESEPYDATSARQHWQCGPCPSCGNDNHGGNGRYYVAEGRIDERFSTVVLDE